MPCVMAVAPESPRAEDGAGAGGAPWFRGSSQASTSAALRSGGKTG